MERKKPISDQSFRTEPNVPAAAEQHDPDAFLKKADIRRIWMLNISPTTWSMQRYRRGLALHSCYCMYLHEVTMHYVAESFPRFPICKRPLLLHRGQRRSAFWALTANLCRCSVRSHLETQRTRWILHAMRSMFPEPGLDRVRQKPSSNNRAFNILWDGTGCS